jgi:ribonuclease BN (tRNA processing enzyme)
MIEVVFLGTTGWYDTKAGNTISTLIKTRDFNIVLDAGNGIAKLPGYIDHNKPTYLFISHFHMDHVEGLHTICMNKFYGGLNIIVHEGGTGYLQTLMNEPYMGSLSSMRFASRIIETKDGSCELPFPAYFLPMQHNPFCQGIRMEVDGITISHCLDTGYCENAVALSRNADLLIIECTLKPGETSKSHLTPELCARVAWEASVKKLALTHFEGKRYPDIESRKESAALVKSMFEESFLCLDDMAIQL